MNRALFPAMADNRDQTESLTRLFLLALQLQTLIALPATVGLALVAGEAVPVLLGSKWQEAVPLLQWLALAGIAQVLTASGHYVLIVLGRVGHSVAILWLQVAVFGAAVWLALPLDNAGTIAALRVAVTVLGIAATAALLVAALAPLTLSALSGAVVRPVVATLLMTAALIELGKHLPFAPATVLIVKIALGVLVYAASVITLWKLAGRPHGAETWLFDKYRTWQEGKHATTNDT
jgi:O-antigen/teichoic acid export membrane protein